MFRQLLLCLIVAFYACKANPENPRVTAANEFTDRYAHSRFAKWNIQASASGRDCGVLLVETSLALDASLVEALHYGAGVYAIVDGGVEGFLRKRGFRGAIYRDPTRRHWDFGVVRDDDPAELEPCD